MIFVLVKAIWKIKIKQKSPELPFSRGNGFCQRQSFVILPIFTHYEMLKGAEDTNGCNMRMESFREE